MGRIILMRYVFLFCFGYSNSSCGYRVDDFGISFQFVTLFQYFLYDIVTEETHSVCFIFSLFPSGYQED